MFPTADVQRGRAATLSDDGQYAARGSTVISIVRHHCPILGLGQHKSCTHEAVVSVPASGGSSPAEVFTNCAWSPPGLGRGAECLLASLTSHSRAFVHTPAAPGHRQQWQLCSDLASLRSQVRVASLFACVYACLCVAAYRE